MPLDADSLPELTELRSLERDVIGRIKRTSRSRPLATVALIAAMFQAYAAYRLYSPLSAGEWPRLRDSVIFEYHGWHMIRGERLYIDLWEIKPPLAFELTSFTALLSGGDVAVYHTLNLLVTSGAIVASAVLSAAIVRERTGDSLGAIVGGLAVFTLPAYFWRALIGFKSKYFVILFGLLVVWLLLRERTTLAGVAAACIVGFWQLAAVFPIGGVIWTFREGGYRNAGRFVAGGLGMTALMLLPVLAMGAIPAMIAEAVLTPFLVTEQSSAMSHLQRSIRLLGKTFPIAVLGLVGYAGSVSRNRLDREWLLLAAVAWFGVMILFFDLDFYPDLFPWFAFVGIGAGLAVGRDSGHSRQVLAAFVLVMAVLSVATMGGYGTGSDGVPGTNPFDTTAELTPNPPYNGQETQYVFWNGIDADSCRLFAGRTQSQLVTKAKLGSPNDRLWDVPCGELGPVWDAVVEKYS